MSSEVPMVRTPIDAQQAEQLLKDAWAELRSEPITEGVLRLLLALWDLETDAGRAQFNHNFGNMIQVTDGPFYRALDSGNPRRFVAFPSVQAGARGFVRQLTRDSRAHWREGLLSEDPMEFARQLKKPPAYYEAPLERYSQTLLRRWRRYSHLAGDAPQPPRTERGLVCPVNAQQFREQHLIRLFPGSLQQWTIAVRARPDTTPADLQSLVREIFSFWQPLFPGKIESPRLTGIDVAPPAEMPFTVREPIRFVRAVFPYDGPATAMGLPTFVQRRRQRIEPTCPVEPFDAVPFALTPGPRAIVRAPLKPRPRTDRDPLNLGLGPIEPDRISEALEQAGRHIGNVAGQLALGAGLVLGGYLLYNWSSRRRRV